MSPLRIVVVGCGHMGRLHAEKIAALGRETGEVVLAGVADVDPARARDVGAQYGVRAAEDFRSLLAVADAAIIAVPTVTHYEVVEGALAAGCDVLVEKPIAATVEEAEKLLALARRDDRLLQVGHLEWFNSAMSVIREHIDRPRFAEIHRLGAFPDRSTDIDVVRDLMIHDLDILGRLLGEQPERIDAVGIPVLTDSVDIANARLVYPGGCVANLTASRVSATPMRKLRFFQRDGYFSIDFLEQSALVVRRVHAPGDAQPRIETEKLEVDRGDALLAQLRAFVHAARTREPPATDGSGGLDALRTALRVIDAMPSLEELVAREPQT